MKIILYQILQWVLDQQLKHVLTQIDNIQELKKILSYIKQLIKEQKKNYNNNNDFIKSNLIILLIFLIDYI